MRTLLRPQAWIVISAAILFAMLAGHNVVTGHAQWLLVALLLGIVAWARSRDNA